jgi:hypothetical protein
MIEMKMKINISKLIIVGLMVIGIGINAQTTQSALPEALQGLKIGGLFYISYQNGKAYTGTPDETMSYNQFVMGRGYLDVQKTITSYFMGRYTTDITRDGTGDWKTRVKYLYGKFSWKGGAVFSAVGVEFGQVHNPWLDFEESINGFRMQGTMFLERSGIFNSADVGFTAGANLGGKVSESYQKTVNSHYAGRYGTVQVGVYNGGGYHASERNENKVIGGRLTVRPLPDVAPGLQFSGLVMTGEGNVSPTNTASPPDWSLFDGMVSYEMPNFTGTAQYYRGKGNQSGSAIFNGNAREQKGYSLFGAIHFADQNRVSVLGRYDYFDSNTDVSNNDVQKRFIAGVAYDMHKGNTWLIDYQRINHSASGIPSEDQVQLTLQVKF